MTVPKWLHQGWDWSVMKTGSPGFILLAREMRGSEFIEVLKGEIVNERDPSETNNVVATIQFEQGT
jgi:hypothetical protein